MDQRVEVNEGRKFLPPRGVLGRTGRTVVPRPDLPRRSGGLGRAESRAGAYRGKNREVPKAQVPSPSAGQ